MISSEFQVEGMSCEHCEQSISQLLLKIPGVKTVLVSAITGKLTVETEAEIPPEKITTAVAEAGYTAIKI